MDIGKKYVFAITDSGNEINLVLEQKKLYSVSYRDIAAVVCDIGEKEQWITEPQLRKGAAFHEQGVEWIMARSTILPMRMLTLVSGHDGILAMLEQHYEEFRANLTRLAGQAEFGLKVLWPAETIKARLEQYSVPAIRYNSLALNYLQKKFAAYRQGEAFQTAAEEQIARISDFFTGRWTEQKLRRLPTDNLLLNAAYLVENIRRQHFIQAFYQLKKNLPELKYQFSGPWPPYNFIIMKSEKTLAELYHQ